MAASLTDWLRQLEASPATVVWSMPDGGLQTDSGTRPRGLLSGSFNPLHDGHTGLRAAAEQCLGNSVFYELSICNVDKAALDASTIQQRRQQFADRPLALSNAPTFVEKARLFPETTFVLGADTAMRIVEPAYYRGQSLRKSLSEIQDLGCDFLVAGRALGGKFVSLSAIEIPTSCRKLFLELPTEAFRKDVSSTVLRSADQQQ